MTPLFARLLNDMTAVVSFACGATFAQSLSPFEILVIGIFLYAIVILFVFSITEALELMMRPLFKKIKTYIEKNKAA